MKELRKKTDYYWNHCTPKLDEDICHSIRNKTLQKIEAESASSFRRAKDPAKKRVFLRTASIAASAAILIIAFFSINHLSKDNTLNDIIASTEQIYEEENEQVTLIMSNSERIHLDSEALISYSVDGSFKVGLNTFPGEEKSEEAYNRLLVPKGKRSELRLSDGTKIWVNSGSKVIFPTVFKKNKREIYVDGEVYMEVAHDAGKPFFVNTEGFELKVLGTAFNIFAYKENSKREVALVNGKVSITDKNNKSINMVPNKLVSIENNRIIGEETIDAENYKAWVDKILILNGESLESILNRLNMMYNVRIVCDSSLKAEELYGKFNLNNDIEEILDYLKIMLPVSFYKENGIIHLTREEKKPMSNLIYLP